MIVLKEQYHNNVPIWNMPLTVDAVRDACISTCTRGGYRGAINAIVVWAREVKCDSTLLNDESSINLDTFTTDHFEEYLLYRMNHEKTIKVGSLSGHRSALKELFRTERRAVPDEFEKQLNTFFLAYNV